MSPEEFATITLSEGSPTITQPTSDDDLSNAAVLHGNEASENMLFSPSPNAMDDNWGGIQYTQHLIDSGYYADNEVKKWMMLRDYAKPRYYAKPFSVV